MSALMPSLNRKERKRNRAQLKQHEEQLDQQFGNEAAVRNNIQCNRQQRVPAHNGIFIMMPPKAWDTVNLNLNGVTVS